ncbi:hypothetical protein [Salinactinospora qingdaonensis]|uniref:Uncharacterized protein n=1 Tax=Salinactinospora qingdaonensis TaxID=702744 RepID=A0ABP7G097_9ACTN
MTADLRARTHRRRPLAVAAAVLCLCAPVGTTPAWATQETPAKPLTTEPPYVTDTSRVERFAAGLRDSPLYVDPEVASVLPAGERAPIEEKLAESDVPLRVLVASSSRHSAAQGERDVVLHALHHLLDEDAVYVLVEPHFSFCEVTVIAFGVPVSNDALEDIEDLSREDLSATETLGRLASGVAAAPDASPAAPDLPYAVWELTDDSEEAGEEDGSSDEAEGWVTGLLFFCIGAVCALLTLALFKVVSSSAARGARRFGVVLDRPERSGEAGRPHEAARNRDAPRRPAPGWLSNTLNRELAALNRELEQAPQDHPARQRAVNTVDAVGLLIGESSDSLDLVGAVVLVRDARQSLAAPEKGTWPVCMVNPLHGKASVGSTARLPTVGKVKVCARCGVVPEQKLLDHRVLQVQHAGSWVPHYELDRFWVQVRYGDRVENFPERVLEELGVH